MKPEDKKFYKSVTKALLPCLIYLLLLIAAILLLPASAEGAETDCTYYPEREEAALRQAQVNAAAWCIWTEARGETLEGKQAVMSVILNRSERSGKSLVYEVFKYKQFSGVGRYVPDWFTYGPDGILWPAVYDNPIDRRACLECYGLAWAAVSGNFRPIGPWTHYYAYRDCSPCWAEGLSEVRIIGNHRFGITK